MDVDTNGKGQQLEATVVEFTKSVGLLIVDGLIKLAVLSIVILR